MQKSVLWLMIMQLIVIAVIYSSCNWMSSTILVVTVHFNTSVLTVDEGSNFDILLIAQGTFDESFTVNLTFTDGTASECLL